MKKNSWITVLLITISIAATLLYYIHISNYTLPTMLFSFQNLNSVIASLTQPDTTTESTTTTTTSTTTTTTITSTTTTTTTTTPFEIVVDMDDRNPSYKLATRNGSKPNTDGAQAKLIDILHLYDRCRQNSLTTVVDVGANLGDFGLYAAACGCTVYMFEIQLMMVSLIQISIKINEFSPSSVHVYHNAVADLPYNSTLEDETGFSTIPTTIQTIQLDDISWPSSIFILRVNFDDFELDVLRSGEELFREKRIQHLILYYDTVVNDQVIKNEIIEHLRKVLRPKYIYLFHLTEKKLYGPLNNQQLKHLPSQKNQQRPIIGLFAVFDMKTRRASIKAESFNPVTFFA